MPDVRVTQFRWTDQKSQAAIGLAQGYSQTKVAKDYGIVLRTLQRWVADPEFSAEVDRLSLMVGIASRAERLRIAQRAVRARVIDEDTIFSKADLLDWLKYAQSETDGIRLDLAAFFAPHAPVADEGPGGPAGPTDRRLPDGGL